MNLIDFSNAAQYNRRMRIQLGINILSLLATTVAGTCAYAGSSDKPKFVCVETRSPQPFIVRGTMVNDRELDDVVIRRVETKRGRISKTLWQEKAGSVDVDYRFHATASQWRDTLPFRVEDEGPVSEATLYMPSQMQNREGPSVIRSRMKIKLKSGGPEMDLRLHCART